MMEKGKITYRKFKPDEIGVLIDYRIKFLFELQGEQTFKKEQELRKELTDYFGSLSDNSFTAWIAELEGKPIGFGAMVIQRIPGHFKIPNGKIGYILNMYTTPKYRKNGICSILLDKLIDEARTLGLSKVSLHASDDGIELYRKKGFIEPDLPELELKF
jgi:GNAT superfamily N-acetyltransferase